MTPKDATESKMTKDEFLHYLDMHGADFSRWNGADLKAAQNLLDSDKALSSAYEEARALDQALMLYKVPEDRVAEIQENFANQIPQTVLVVQKSQTYMRYGGAFAMILAVIAVLFHFGTTPQSVSEPEQQVSTIALAEDNLVPIAEIEEVAIADMEDDLAMKELASLWQMAQADIPAPASAFENTFESNTVPAATPAISDEELDELLNELFEDSATDPVLEREMELWELFLETENATL